MAGIDSDHNLKSTAILSDDALKEITGGMNGNDAQFMAESLFKQFTDGATGPTALEAGYSEEDSIAAFKAAFRTLKIKDMPAG
jgi:hypothetical protein